MTELAEARGDEAAPERPPASQRRPIRAAFDTAPSAAFREQILASFNMARVLAPLREQILASPDFGRALAPLREQILPSFGEHLAVSLKDFGLSGHSLAADVGTEVAEGAAENAETAQRFLTAVWADVARDLAQRLARPAPKWIAYFFGFTLVTIWFAHLQVYSQELADLVEPYYAIVASVLLTAAFSPPGRGR